ncbi:alpha/beta-hydrolase [Conidiobolus coronatus NRRL 28638]|uniref:Alpha/beta-hydrolase n=1 Tax=Conidiobolus coronatus (strain ATCC 28846 / CBS 209.66 / NRRL 28638) TaxID=796925 RepID=A0A137NUQ1_CONC2|nr:alpha/beta-hydrolase [Conidiobolus coronatus NRRL 28638]|eukprot:KXN66510.1 alpha/beta-hydrolase [Conidiobolus coronatus NRRL 28638]
MNFVVDKLKLTANIAKGIFLYNIYGPPCKSWNLKTWLAVYLVREIFGNLGSLPVSRARIKINFTTQVKNSKTELVTIQDKFRQRAHELVKEHLKEVYGDDEWYGPESHWSKSHPLESEWVIPNHLTRSSNSNVILYIHGGAYILGHFSTYRSELETLAQNTDSIVLGTHYRLASEYSAPCQLEDALAHVLYLTSPVEDSGIGLSFDQIIVSGDSAGGGLSSILNHFMRDAKIGKLAGSLLYSPWVDLTTGQPSCTECTDTDTLSQIEHTSYDLDEKGEIIPGLFNTIYQASNLEFQNKMIERGHFLAPKKYVNSPLISPLCDTNFKDLPPTLIITGQVEAVRDESILYQELINNSYSDEELSNFEIPPTTLHLYEEMFHDFPFLALDLPSSQMSIKRAINFIKQCFAQNTPDFANIQEDNPINIKIEERDAESSMPKQWKNLYLSTISDQSLVKLSPCYKRNSIQTWIK